MPLIDQSGRHLILWTLLAAFLFGCGSEPAADDDAYDHVMPFDTAGARLVRRAIRCS
jgi:hypothetical protein